MKVIVAFLVALTCSLSFAQSSWIETTQEDFADGIFERNIIASHQGGGTLEFIPSFDLNVDGYVDLWTADADGPYVRIYWGDSTGYSPSNFTLFPTSGAANCDAADLNGDGYPDFIVAHRNVPKVTVYWGTPAGPQPGFYFDIPTVHQESQAVFAADLNKDGYTDIITSLEIYSGHSAILWGSILGYNINNRTDLPITFGIHNIEIADFNKDTWLDILFVQYIQPYNVIYWGSDSGFYPANNTLLPGPDTHGASIADLNKDTYIDIVFNAWNGNDSYIYWGDSTGFQPTNMQVLYPGSCYGGSMIQDIDNDAYLDIVFHRSNGPQLIYWGSPVGYSDDSTSTINYTGRTSGGIIADLNNDNFLDIFFNRMSSASHILWGPDFTSSLSFPVNNDHHAMFREIGNVYDRKYYDSYISSIYNADDTVFWWRISWTGNCPAGCDMVFSIRTGNTSIPDTTWSNWIEVDSSSLFPDSLRSQYIQYKTQFFYTTIAFFPSLFDVCISYDSVSGISTYRNRTSNPLLAIYPNPFKTKIAIDYIVERSDGIVVIEVYDIQGRSVRTLVNEHRIKGTYSITWDGRNTEGNILPCGVYYIKYQVNRTSFATKIIYLSDDE
ncbi:VCBS repeat-containing protein [candidate division WOR-3 bacterium]|nr:VCBS repeat-containing protein [candidate division WOR-3 bacterium]